MRRPSVKHGHTFLSQITIFVHYLDGWPSHGDSADNIYLIHLKRSLRENIHPIVVWIVVKGYSNSCHMCSYILVTSTFASALFPFWIQFFQFHTLSHAGANICPQNLKLSIGSIFLKRLFIHPCSQIYFRSEKVHSASICVWWCAPFLLPRDTHNMDHLFRGGPHIFDISLRLFVSNILLSSQKKGLLRRSMNTIWSLKSSNATFWRRVTWNKMFQTAIFA